MATLYWGGGAGTWSSTDTTHWYSDFARTTLAGVAPTSADNVIFDSASNATAYAVTIGLTASPAAGLDVSIAGPATGNVTITSAATSVLNVYGSWLNAATGVAFSSVAGCNLNFLATTTGKTVTTNNITLTSMNVVFNGVGGGWTLGSALTCTAQITPNNGTFSTGNFAISCNTFATTSATTRSISLGSSAITCTTNLTFNSVVGLTFNAGTSTINLSNAGPTFTGGDQTFYNVNFTSATAAINTVAINGTNTFNNLNVTTTTLQKIIQLGADQTVNGTLTLGATNTAPFRMSVVSSVIGTQRTLTVATIATLNDVDFRDINAAGTSSPWTGTRIGNCLGNNNSSIYYDGPKNVYWNLPAGGNWTDTAWALTPGGGAVAVNNFPLPQDFVTIENFGLNVGATITINTNADIGRLTMAARTTALTLALNNADPKFYGNVTLSSALTLTGNTAGSPTFNFLGQGLTNTFNSAGVTLALSQFNVNCPTGTLTLSGNATVQLTAAVGQVIHTAGIFNLNGFGLTTVLYSSNGTGVRTLAFGIGNITLTGVSTTIFDTSTTTNMTTTGTPVVNCAATTGTSIQTRVFIVGTFAEAQAISVNINPGTSAVDIFRLATNTGSFKNITFSSTFTGTVQISNTINIFGNLDFGGATVYSGTSLVTFASTSGTKTITTNNITFGGGVTFSGVGGAWACSDALRVAGALTFSNGTLNLAAGTTSTVGSFVTTGTSPKFLGSTTPGTQATISDASGTNTVSCLTIQDSNATGGAVWDALSITNIDAGDNTGWLFSSGPRLVNEITMRLRSFAQPRRF